MDFRQHKNCFEPYFPNDFSNKSDASLSDPVVLQIVSVGNISQPLKRRNDDSFNNINNRLLSIQVTDGHTKATALELEIIPNIKPSTPPGSKLLYQGGQVIKGKILLNQNNCLFLDGKVMY